MTGLAATADRAYPSLSEATRVWARVAALSFGGPAGQIAVMHRIIVEDQRKFTGHMLDRPRHTQQLDYFAYEFDIRTREMPAGIARAGRASKEDASCTRVH